MKNNINIHSWAGVCLASSMRYFSLVACLMMTAAISASGAVIYTSSYDGSTLPTATVGTTANPKWALGGNSGTYSATSTGGVLNAVTTGNASYQWWNVGTNGGVTYAGSTAGVWNTSTATVDFNLQVTAGTGGNASTGNGFAIQLSDLSNRFYSFYIGPTSFFYQTGASTGTTITTASLGIDTSLYHTYRIAMDGGKASLYIDDNATPIFSLVSGFTIATRTAILFGDLSTAESGSYNLNSMSWSNTTAEFLAPIPEPSVIALASLAGLIGIVMMRHRTRNQS